MIYERTKDRDLVWLLSDGARRETPDLMRGPSTSPQKTPHDSFVMSGSESSHLKYQSCPKIDLISTGWKCTTSPFAFSFFQMSG